MRSGTRVLAAILVAGLAACSGVESPQRPIEPSRPAEAESLLDPFLGFPWTIDPGARSRIDAVWRGLVAGSSSTAALDDVRRLLAADPGLWPARLVLAQERILRGEDAAALDLLDPVLEASPDYTAARMARGRARERVGDLLGAYEDYHAIAGLVPLAGERASALESAALAGLQERFDDALARGLWPRAEETLVRLRSSGADPVAVRDAELRYAVAVGDELEELRVMRRVVEESVPEAEAWIRLAELETSVGDLRRGIEIAEDLRAEFPDDPALARVLRRGQLSWRLQTAPAAVRESASHHSLTRAEVAALFYWLVPEIRTATTGSPPIASDILDHAFRREILQVIGLELLDVDRVLHRFEPDVAARRADVLGALLRWRSGDPEPPHCLGAAEDLLADAGTGVVCAFAARCSLVPTEADCLPEGPVSGSEIVGLLAAGAASVG